VIVAVVRLSHDDAPVSRDAESDAADVAAGQVAEALKRRLLRAGRRREKKGHELRGGERRYETHARNVV
jgi:hypothetical protein